LYESILRHNLKKFNYIFTTFLFLAQTLGHHLDDLEINERTSLSLPKCYVLVFFEGLKRHRHS